MATGCGVKICGTTSLADARLAAEHGADCFGVVIEVDFSPRSLTIEEARPLFADPPLPGVALVFNMEPDRVGRLVDTLRPHAVQFLNLEELSHIRKLKQEYPEMEVWQSIHLPEAGREVDLQRFQQTVRNYVDAGADLLIFDTVAVLNGVTKFGGTGLVSDWDLVKQLIDQSGSKVPIWLAGGINPDNVVEAIRTVRPDGVDLCSGVEASPGIKDPDKVRLLIKRAKSTQ